MIKSGRTATFGELAKNYFNTFTSPLSTHKCYCVHVVFDQYLDDSIKAGERARRGSSSALEVYIGGPATPVPKQCDKYISNPNNKKNLCDFLTHSMCNLGQRHLRESTQLVIGGGLKDGERCVAITRDSCVDVEDLKSNQEEADTRMLLHAKYAAGQCQEEKIVIQSPDTDVLVLSAAHFEDIASKELWFRTGVKDRLRFVPVHDVCQNLSNRVLKALPAFHSRSHRLWHHQRPFWNRQEIAMECVYPKRSSPGKPYYPRTTARSRWRDSEEVWSIYMRLLSLIQEKSEDCWRA